VRGAEWITFAIVGLTLGCGAPPVSPLQGVAAEHVKAVVVRGNNATGQLTHAEHVEAFVRGLHDLEPFKTGKVSPDLDIDVVLHQGSPIHLRMGRDHIGPAVPGSDVVWRWRLRDETPYALARGALLTTPQ